MNAENGDKICKNRTRRQNYTMVRKKRDIADAQIDMKQTEYV